MIERLTMLSQSSDLDQMDWLTIRLSSRPARHNDDNRDHHDYCYFPTERSRLLM